MELIWAPVTVRLQLTISTATTSRLSRSRKSLGPNQFGEKPTLPSALYIPHPEEFPEDGFRLPWTKGQRQPIVGHFARDHGALVPDRLITSAKSWLSNFHIDPKKPVLPWKSDIKEEKLSAFDCSRRYLEHMREGFLYAERAQGRAWNLAEGQVVLTVPPPLTKSRGI